MNPPLLRRRQPQLNRRMTVSILQLLIAIYIIRNLLLSWVETRCNLKKKEITSTASVWHGGHPAHDKSGSCWCSEDNYCLCTPNVAIDLVIASSGKSKKGTKEDYVWLVRRKDTNQFATMGGFVEVGESTEETVARELAEEMSLKLEHPPKLFGVYSDPRRDNRRHTVSIAYVAHVSDDIQPTAGDDAKEVVKVPVDEIESIDFFSDHKTILLDYVAALRNEVVEDRSTKGDFPENVQRSTCGIFNTPEKHN